MIHKSASGKRLDKTCVLFYCKAQDTDWENSCKKMSGKVLTNARMNGIISKLFREGRQALRKEVQKDFAAQKNLKKVLDKRNLMRYNK